MGNCLAVSSDSMLPPWQRWDDHPARRDWEPLRDLGAGSFSSVVLARHKETGELAALKIIWLKNPDLDPETSCMLQQEGSLLREAGHHHPGIVECRQIIPDPADDPKALVLVLEYLEGGSLLDGLPRLAGARYSERHAAGLFTQIASAVAHLHALGIIHRDIKPENVMLVKRLIGGGATTPQVKLVDLGMAWCARHHALTGQTEHEEERGVLGSAGFVAPETVLGGVHTPAMDMYALGVLLFIMLVGRKPFDIADCEKLHYARMSSIRAAPGLRDPRWLDLSPDAKHLLMGMLTFDPSRRLTAAQVLQHEWVASRGGLTIRLLGPDVALGAATVAEMRRLRFLAHGVVALRRASEAVEKDAARRRRRRRWAFGGDGNRRSNNNAAHATGAVSTGDYCQEHSTYLYELRRLQKREASVRNGLSLRGLARSMAAVSVGKLHDAGSQTVHGASLLDLEWHAGRDVVEGGAKMSRDAGDDGSVKGGMRRSGTALMLSSLLNNALHADDGVNGVHTNAAHDLDTATSAAGDDVRVRHGLRLGSNMKLLGASIVSFVDTSLHGGGQRVEGGSRHGDDGSGSRRGGEYWTNYSARGGSGSTSVSSVRISEFAESEAVRVVSVKVGSPRSEGTFSSPQPRRSVDENKGAARRVVSIAPL